MSSKRQAIPPQGHFSGGLELDFFPRDSLHECENADDPLSIAKHAFSILMMGWPQKKTWGNLVFPRTIRAVLLKRDHELMRHARLAFQEGFIHLQQQLCNRDFSLEQQQQIEFYLSNCLCILPFADLNPYESISIPQYINNTWIMVEYKVAPIELTATQGIEQALLEDNDRVFAYGLSPLQNFLATPHLIFMGTTYPAGQGLRSQLRADMNGFQTAGELLYKNSRHRISEWISQQEKKPHVCGLSLGGTLSLLVAIDQGDQISRVDALNPAGLHPHLLRSTHDKWSTLNPKPQVYIQKQGNDPVSRYGYWKEDWQILHVNPPASKKGPNALADHALNYAGFAETTFTKIDARQDNHQRRWRNRLIYTFARGLLYYSIILPYYYFIQPLFRLTFKPPHTGLFLFIATWCLFFAPWSIALPVVGLSSVFLFYHAIQLAQRLITVRTPHAAACHQPKLKRNGTLDLYQNRTTEMFSKQELDDYMTLLKECGENHALFSKQSNFQRRVHKEVKDAVREETETICVLEASKAKIYDIKYAINLMKHWGLHRPRTALIDAVSKQHQHYLDGLDKI